MNGKREENILHTYCSPAFDNGDDPKTVQTNLGHATPEFTQRVYANSTEGMRKNSAERMGKKMSELCEKEQNI